MLVRIILSLLVCNTLASGQTPEAVDSLVDKMCNTLSISRPQGDSAMIRMVYGKDLFPYLKKFPPEERTEAYRSVHIRLQRECRIYSDIVQRLSTQKGDWVTLKEKPKTNLKKRACREFLDQSNYAYLETSGDTVKVDINKGSWTDHFKDGTYSKLALRWVQDCEFEIEFIESNNNIRKSLSRPGDKYRYQVVDKKDGYYLMTVSIVGNETLSSFKIYYKARRR